MLNNFSRVQLFATLWTITCQAPLSMGFSGKNIGMGCQWVAMHSSRVSSQPTVQPKSLASPALAGEFFTTSTTWEAKYIAQSYIF